MIGIYCIRHRESGMCYVGQSRDIQKRIRVHFGSRRKDCRVLKNAVAKYGKDAFIVEILEICEEDNLNGRERHWIASLDCVRPKGFNLKDGGNGGRLSEETRRKISVAHQGKSRVFSPEHCRNLSAALKGNICTAETRKKIGEANRKKRKGRKHSLETRKKMSETRKKRFREQGENCQ